MIIHAKEDSEEGITRFNFTDHLRNQLEFGPIFNKKFLKEVLKLQQKIEDLDFKYRESDGLEHTYKLNKGLVFFLVGSNFFKNQLFQFAISPSVPRLTSATFRTC